MRVIIAEDDAVSRTILRRSLERLGHECLAAEDGHETLELYRHTPEVDLVISDWMMLASTAPACAASSGKTTATATPTSSSSRP